MVEPDDQQVEVLRAVCDTFVPSVEHVPDPYGFWARSATDMGVDSGILQALAGLPDEDAVGLLALIDAIHAQGFLEASQASREQVLRTMTLSSTQAAAGLNALKALTLAGFYAGVDPETGQNPNWQVFGYPGPTGAPAERPNRLPTVDPSSAGDLESDVVVIGSGAGGGVIAGELAKQGLSVVVLEAGGQYDERDFNGSELWAYQNLYWRGGPNPTADGNISLMAGSCLGGGTVVNWTNSLRTPPWVREEWAGKYGLKDVADDFDRHLDAVWSRLSVNDRCSELNIAQQKMQTGAQALGWHFEHTNRNADASLFDPATAGHMGFGDRSGSKQSTTATYLRDAVEAGARLVVRCRVERVVTEDGRAAGVEGTVTDPQTGSTSPVKVRAGTVVVAGGALESPSILLRSGLGGAAVGQYLRLHPCTATLGLYDEDTQAWWGAPHAGVIEEFGPLNDGYGFLIEGAQYTTAVASNSVPWVTGEQHKATMADFSHGASFIGLVRDQGHGTVTIDDSGNSVVRYSLSDPRDQASTHRAIDAQVRCHAAAGAARVAVLANTFPLWHRGEDDLDAFVAKAQRIPLRVGAMSLFSAHQMGTCRMGKDPETSVADPYGQLHDTPGVWIGDGSAFPTPSGVNPMITIMALAHRTAEHIAQEG